MSRHVTPTVTVGRQRLNLVVIAAGIIAAVVLALTFSGTLSAFTQAFVHPANKVSTQSLGMVESNSSGETVMCDPNGATSVSCTSTNLYGGQVLSPGSKSELRSVTFKNNGATKPSTFRITGGTCTTAPTSGSDLCTKLVVLMTWRGESVSNTTITPASLASGGVDVPNAPDPGAHSTLDVQVMLPANATDDTSGVTLTQDLTFTFGI